MTRAQTLQIIRLQRRYGLSSTVAAVIAGLFFGDDA